ncbi:anti-sigma regulatory factor (Ser/Thr protein kinase) [Belliella baltica DSM 15883]|uniref:Anti-sigma regulatory factor (Ser/Thr protein kinase) n=1 Tax=Belliella baltica (strain DSM 15883 / CIP 108006 / LMG 21964 / BA134) TaxID=866536 RepID=I3Z265_BELBD|nr:ATP-binding protein [Belliella baltica]AFL83333.1 anti-sigma regulatory factor (Ser/Thr protein kinase) [Belliella baltica DSM 15883]
MRHELKLYCDTTRLADLRIFLSEILQSTSLSEIEQHQVTLAVDEVCANLIIHSHGCNVEEFIQIGVEKDAGILKIEIRDSGEGFNITEYREPEITHVKKAKRKGGLGIILVKKIMDKIEFESSGKQNTCRLFKNLKSK